MATELVGITIKADRIPKGAEPLWITFSCLRGAEAITIREDACIIYFPDVERGLSFNNLVQDTMASPRITSRIIERRELYENRVKTFQEVANDRDITQSEETV